MKEEPEGEEPNMAEFEKRADALYDMLVVFLMGTNEHPTVITAAITKVLIKALAHSITTREQLEDMRKLYADFPNAVIAHIKECEYTYPGLKAELKAAEPASEVPSAEELEQWLRLE